MDTDDMFKNWLNATYNKMWRVEKGVEEGFDKRKIKPYDRQLEVLYSKTLRSLEELQNYVNSKK